MYPLENELAAMCKNHMKKYIAACVLLSLFLMVSVSLNLRQSALLDQQRLWLDSFHLISLTNWYNDIDEYGFQSQQKRWECDIAIRATHLSLLSKDYDPSYLFNSNHMNDYINIDAAIDNTVSVIERDLIFSQKIRDLNCQ